MPYDLNVRSLTPLSELITQAEFPLVEYIPANFVSDIFDGLFAVEHYFSFDGDNLVLECQLAFPQEIALSLPGAESFALVLGSAGPGWTVIPMRLTIGPDFSLILKDLTAGLRFDPAVLRDPNTNKPAELSFACTINLSSDGLRVSDYAGLSLSKSALCGTDILVEADDLRLTFDGDALPPFLADSPEFRGVTFAKLAISIPDKYLSLDAGNSLHLTIADAAIGNTGFTGQARLASTGAGISGDFVGFPCRVRSFGLDIVENALVAAGLSIDVRLKALEQRGGEKWVGLDVDFHQDGSFAAKASAIQPAGASSTSAALVTLDYPDAVRLALDGLRITRNRAGPGDVWAVYFTGDVEVLIPGATWPRIDFDEIGVNSLGDLLLPEGGGITFASPLVVEWYFVRLTIPKFRFGRPEGSDHQLRVQLSAEVELLEGLPAGGSVDGLTITWDPSSNASPEVSFSGIGVEFGVPGVFSAGAELSFQNDGGSVEFRGQGHLELNSLDVGMQIGVIIGFDQAQNFAYLYLFADAKLLPSGIPVGSSGLAIYGFQGLIAYNMALELDTNIPEDERYYQLFIKPTVGITDIDKWRKKKNQNALGIGVVFGTVDSGFAFNCKGLIAVAFPDLVLLLQAKASFLKTKSDLSTASEGTMDALMVFDSVQSTYTFDVVAKWGIPNIFEVSGSARAFFDFDDPGAFYLRIGQDQNDKRVSANVIRWGDSWLFSAGFWFELNSAGVITGVLIEVGFRYEAGGFWIEAIGRARGEMSLYWGPPQWEGALALEGRIGAGYRGISVGLALSGDAKARVFRPTYFQVSARACFKALFWEVCLGHAFRWENNEPPQLEQPFQGISAKPFNWTLRVTGLPSPGEGGGQATADDGIVALVPAVTGELVQPHSCLQLEFSKPMIDKSGLFNGWVPLPDEGFLTIGETSGYAASYELLSAQLVRDPDGEHEIIESWGVWSAQTPHYNTQLRLHSSKRFEHDGSLSESYVEGIELDYCADVEDRRICVPLRGITPGHGWTESGHAYHWDTSKSRMPFADRRNDPFVELLAGDRLTVVLPRSATDVGFEVCECPPRPSHGGKGEFDGDESSARISTSVKEGEPLPGRPNEDGSWSVSADGNVCVEDICYSPGHSPSEYTTGTRRGGTQTQHETWTVPKEARLLRPGSTYEVSVEVKNTLRYPDGSRVEQPQQPWKSRFNVASPPLYAGALREYVGASYPANGARPIYTGYDFMVRFVDDYVTFLYPAGRQQLLIRLFDGQGRPVTDQHGNPVLLPATREGQPDRSLSELHWERQYRINVERGCIADDLGERKGESVLTIPGNSIQLTPNSQYRAQIVSDADLRLQLHEWTFTTSAYSGFEDLVTRNHRLASPIPVTPAATVDFTTQCRALGIETVAYTDRFTITPMVSPDRERCHAILLDSPEPLDATTRLTIEVDHGPVEIRANGDETRLILLKPGGDWPAGKHELLMRWSRGAAGDPAEQLRAVHGDLTEEKITITFTSAGL